ncbi:MAG: SUMF1/EgtB/PvdO family nonheme iron enzyme [Chloroflexota bacterium]
MTNRPYAPRPITQMRYGCIIIPMLVGGLVLGALLYVRLTASDQLIVLEQEVLLVRALPDDEASLIARFGEGYTVEITGRTDDWRWLEIEVWDGQRGWIKRPLSKLVWQLDAKVTPAIASVQADPPVEPIEEKMISIPATTFTMGSPPTLGKEDEHPAHPVSLSAFEIDQTEVTIGQYWQCVIAGVCAAPTSYATQTHPHYLSNPAFDNYPMVNVPWTEANAYCLWRGKRLPTEAEWEMAASWDIERGAKSFWVWGNDPSQGQGNVAEATLTQTTLVGSFTTDQSPAGVLDMAGNVSEWVFDWYKVDYYSVTDETDPVGPTHRRGEGAGRVIRGGSFADTDLNQARSANRRYQAEVYGYPTVGFRCAR